MPLQWKCEVQAAGLPGNSCTSAFTEVPQVTFQLVGWPHSLPFLLQEGLDGSFLKLSGSLHREKCIDSRRTFQLIFINVCTWAHHQHCLSSLWKLGTRPLHGVRALQVRRLSGGEWCVGTAGPGSMVPVRNGG